MRGLRFQGEYFVVSAEGNMNKDNSRYFGKVQVSDGVISQILQCGDPVIVEKFKGVVEEKVNIEFQYLEDRFGPKMEVINLVA